MSKPFIKNSIFSLASQILPLAAGLLLIPFILNSVGKEAFGFLTIAWSILGYFTILDLGVSRSLTRVLAETGSSKTAEISELITSSSLLVLFLSTGSGLLLFSLKDYIASEFLNISDENTAEAILAIGYIGISVPVVSLLAMFRGVFDGLFELRISNTLQILTGLNSFIAPLVAILVNRGSLDNLILAIVLGRLLLLGIALIAARSWFRFVSPTSFVFSCKRVLKVGIYIFLSNITSQIMVYIDRILLGSLVPVARVAFYSTPQEIVSRFWVVPTAITRISFISFSEGQKSESRAQIFRSSTDFIFALTAPVGFTLILFSELFLDLWLGWEFAVEAAEPLQILTAGVLVNCLNWTTISLYQSSKKLWITTVVPVVELVIFVGLFYIFTQRLGIVGASLAWSIRLILDFLIFSLLLMTDYKELRREGLRLIGLALVILAVAVIPELFPSQTLRFLFWLISMAFLALNYRSTLFALKSRIFGK